MAKTAGRPWSDKNRLLDLLLAAEGVLEPEDAPMDREGPLPLSFQQARLWFLEQLRPGLPVHHVATAVRLRGNLDRAVLSAALTALARRHEALRTSFVADGGDPRALPRSEAEGRWPMPECDLSRLAAATGESESRRHLDLATRSPFAFDQPPLARAHLLSLGDGESRLVLVLHHLITDGWSTSILTRELIALYRAFATDRTNAAEPLPEPAGRYGDYARRQRSPAATERFEADLSYWRAHLVGAPRALELPCDRRRASAEDPRGAHRSVRLAAAPTAAIRALAESARVTPFMVLTTALVALFHRLGAGEDLVLGLPVANRRETDLEGVIGYFANLLPIRIDLTGDPTGSGLLARVREATLGALDHQDLPFERLVEALGLDRDPGRSPVCQATFSLLPRLRDEGAGGDLGFEVLATDTGTVKFDLSLGLREGRGELAGGLDYRSALFDPATVERWLGSWHRLLGALAADPERPLSSLSAFDAIERQQLMIEMGARSATSPRTDRLDDLLWAEAAHRADTVAAVGGVFHLTYGELVSRADRLARRLLDLGIGAGAIVALALDRTPELCIGMAGVLRAGSAYLPLDPTLPAARRDLLLSEAGAKAVVADAGAPGVGGGETGVARVDLGQALEAPQAPVASSPLPASAAAYLLFTSGSTGTPKGVVVTHANVVELLSACRKRIVTYPGDAWSVCHSVAFDFSVWEIWGGLLSGGRLVVVPYWTSRSPESFHRLVGEERVAVASQTPSAFRQWVQVASADSSDRVDPLAALSWIVFGGEALAEADLVDWRRARHGRGPRLANLYGITETTVHSTFLEVSTPAAEGAVGSPIGRPLDHLGARVLSPLGEPVPLGVAGEIHILGAGLAAGYFGQPDLTAARFVPDSYGEPGTRLYRSGDLGRWRADGGLEYLGRIDRQVKVRGHRVELGEVEAALLAHPDVEGAAAALRGTGDEARLVAWFVPRAGAPSGAEEIGAHLRRQLPAPWVPAVLVPLADLPLTPNGKLDRAALPIPGGERPNLAAAYRAPRTEAEEVLASIWARVLDLERVGAEDDFFALGGDSILSLRVRALAEERGLRFDLRQLFERPTVAALAASLDEGTAGAEDEPIAPFALISAADRATLPDEVEDAYPLTAVQAGMLFHMGYRPQRIVYHNVYSFHLRAAYCPAAFRLAIRYAVARHPILRTGFDLANWSEPLQLVFPRVEAALRLHDLSALSAAEQERALDAFVEAEKNRPFELSRPPLIRFALHRRSDDRFNFTFTECHPIFDGWSLHAFLGEVLSTYFAAIDQPRLAPSPPLRRGVSDFVALERRSAENREARDYWSAHLRDCRILRLPRWGALAGEGQRIRIQSRRSPHEEQLALEALARRAAVPLKSVLLAAHLKVLSRLAGERDLVSGLVTSGRPEGADGDRVLGLFFNVLPLRFVVPDGSWENLCRAVFAAEREMLPHRRFPLARVQATQGGAQLFEVLFNFIHFHVLRDLLTSGRLELIGEARRWEETNYPLSVAFMKHPAGERLDLWLRYDEHQFPSWQIARMLGLYGRVLRAMATDPAARHEEQTLLDESERHQLLAEWGTGPIAPMALTGEPWPVRVARQAALHPGLPALRAADGALSYGELARASHRIARRLVRLGVGCDATVGLIAPRGVDAVVGLLGILAAGAAYVPCDPLHPRERIAETFRAAGVRAIVGRWNSDVPDELAAADVFVVDLADSTLAAEPAEAPRVEILPASLAYVIFTSGSTGRPKGVAVEHRQLANYVEAAIERLALEQCSTFTMASTFAADLGGTALFPALALGACLRIVSEEQARDAVAFEEMASRQPFDLLKIVPSHIAALLSAAKASTILPARRLVLGGEALDPLLVERVRALGDCEIWNHYGPTETTVGVAAGRADRFASNGVSLAGSVPIGRPLFGARLYVVDGDSIPVPAGSPGELVIGGAGLARGYLRDPVATALKFVPDALGTVPGERLYRTGDRARHRPDGTLEFLGRRDDQVKIRGFRVELAEVEAALARHPAAREVAIGAVRDRQGEQRLVAYFVAADPAAAPADGELRAFLRRLLPEPMIPSAWVRLPTLPRTPNGKLDRGALPEPRELVSSWQAAYRAPQSELERTIAAVWREVLKIERVGIDDSFLDLGGHSLYMLRVHSKLREVLDLPLSMVELFEHPTIGALAAHLAAASPEEASEVAPDGFEERARARHRSQARRFEQRGERRPTLAAVEEGSER